MVDYLKALLGAAFCAAAVWLIWLPTGWSQEPAARQPAAAEGPSAQADDFRPIGPPPRAGAARGPRRPGDLGPPEGPPPRRDREEGPPRDWTDRPGPPDRPNGTPPRSRDGRPGEPDMPGGPDRPDFRRPPGGPDGPGGPDREGRPMSGRPFGPPWPQGDWAAMERNDPEMFELIQQDYRLERESRDLALQYRDAPEDRREAIRGKLQEAVAQHFESRQERRLLELKRLEEELGRLRESIDKRKEARDDIVHRRVGELLGDDDPLRF